MYPKRDNYAAQAEDARLRFLTYDQSAILANTAATADAHYLYLPVLDRTCRISRVTGAHEWQTGSGWQPSVSHNETLTIFDYLCDAKPHRSLSCEFVSMASLGNYVHSGLSGTSQRLESAIDRAPQVFAAACRGMGASPFPGGDLGFVLDLFPDLPIALRFWRSDEDFPASLDIFWDKNTLQFLRYETLWYAAGILRARLEAAMEEHGNSALHTP